MKKVRVRFAPSPTGALHLGGIRTALYDYLFAKKNGGDFILRIEDTDTARFVPGAEEYIQEALEWCGIVPDESPKQGGNYGPYRQSERRNIYDQYTAEILKTDFAYIAFDTAEELDEMRSKYEAEGEVFAYNYKSRNILKNSLSLSKEDVQQLIDDKVPYVVRFKMPVDRNLVLEDLIRGTSSVNTNTLDDKVLVKNDGMPTYHFANVIDDHEMEISHVIRGEEWLPSLGLHYLLYEAFNWEKPHFSHLSLILKPDATALINKENVEEISTSFAEDFILKNSSHQLDNVTSIIKNLFSEIKSPSFKSMLNENEKDDDTLAEVKKYLKKSLSGKLSKRDGDKFGFPVFPLEFTDPENGTVSKGYREEGYFPEAFINFLALLGWSPADDVEIVSMKEMIQQFDLMKVHKAGARFSKEKAEWFNHHYLQVKSDADLLGRLQNKQLVKEAGLSTPQLQKIINLMKERWSFVRDAVNSNEGGKFFFKRPGSYDEKAVKKSWKEDSAGILTNFVTELNNISETDFTSAFLQEKLADFTAAQSLGMGKVMMPLRLALVGELKGTDVPDILEVLGKKESIIRIENAVKNIH